MLNIKHKQKWITSSLVIMLSLSVAASIWVITWHVNNNHNFNGEIVISNDRDFKKKYHLPGSGTKTDPYRIENLRIFSSKSTGISISDTTQCFVIRNCTIRSFYTAISLSDINSELAVIQNNTLGGTASIIGSSSTKLYIVGNKCISTGAGIVLIDCTSSSVIGNNCSNLFSGIILAGELSNSIVANNTCSNNYDSGILINYWHEYRYQFTHNYNISIINNTCLSNIYGIYIRSYYEIPTEVSPTYIIDSNNCSYNEWVGIGVDGFNLQLTNNYCGFNGINGVSIFSLHNSTITYNQLQNNTDYGLRAHSSSGCYIYANNFYDNNFEGLFLMESQGYDDSNNESYYGPNMWYNSLISEGNYWSELSWSLGITYDIDGGNNSDLFPIQNPIV